MIIIVFLISISIALAKRRDDLVVSKENQILRDSQSGYTKEFIDIAKGISFSVTIVAYIMYSVSYEVIDRLGSDKIYVTSIFVFLGILRFLQVSIVANNSGSPVKLVSQDLFIQIMIVCWILSFVFIIY